MAPDGQLTLGFMPFPDTYISSNLAPVTEENTTSGSHAQVRRLSTADLGEQHGHDSPDSSAQPSKKRRLIFLCEACGTYYTEKRALARHRHTAQHRRNVGLPPAEKYTCTLCNKTFSRDHDRVRHENETHKGQRRFASLKSASQTPSAGPDDSFVHQSASVLPEFPAMECVQEESFVIEDDVRSVQNGWDTLSNTIEVYPGPANRSTSSSHKVAMQGHSEQSQMRVREHPDPDCTRNNSTSTSKSSSDPDAVDSSVNDRNSQSWLAESSDDEDGINGTPDTQLSVKSTNSTTADSAVDLDEDACDVHQPKQPSVTTYDYRCEQQQEGEEVVDSGEQDTEATLAGFSNLTLKPRPHTSVIQRRGKTTTIPRKKPLLCIFCDQVFEEDCRNLLAHLRQHLDMFRGELTCRTCKVGFVHKQDLEMHQVSATVVGHCGFSFDHVHPCTGHHRPTSHGPNVELTDPDRFRLCVQMRQWEQSQLRAYMAEVNQLLAMRSSRASTSYSIEALFRRSRGSFSSFAVSVDTFGSAPCDATVGGQTDVRGIKQRLRMMSFKDSKMQVRKLPHVLRSGSLDKSLLHAATCGDLQQIDELVKLGGRPSAIIGDRSALSAASQRADVDTVRLLIGLGANVHSRCGIYGSALAGAAHAGKLEIVRLLLENGADVRQLGGNYGSALGAAVVMDRIQIAQVLLEQGADVNAKGGDFGCPLSIAALRGNADMVQLLLAHGAHVDSRGGDEGSPIGFAVWYGHHHVVRLLAERGANVNGRGGKHGAPLCAAVNRIAKREGQIRMVKLLLEFGVDVNMQADSCRPLCTAASHADIEAMSEIVKLLLAYGADVNAAGSKGSALQLAKGRRQYWMDRKPFLLQDMNTDDTIGYCYEVIRLLREAGATDGGRTSPSFQWQPGGGISTL